MELFKVNDFEDFELLEIRELIDETLKQRAKAKTEKARKMIDDLFRKLYDMDVAVYGADGRVVYGSDDFEIIV